MPVLRNTRSQYVYFFSAGISSVNRSISGIPLLIWAEDSHQTIYPQSSAQLHRSRQKHNLAERNSRHIPDIPENLQRDQRNLSLMAVDDGFMALE